MKRKRDREKEERGEEKRERGEEINILDRKSTRLNSSHLARSRMPSSA